MDPQRFFQAVLPGGQQDDSDTDGAGDNRLSSDVPEICRCGLVHERNEPFYQRNFCMGWLSDKVDYVRGCGARGR